VSRGESFYSISKKHGITLNELLAWNNKSARSTLRPGDRLDVWKQK
jgi:membrane-bound lytic murein transglycosylase D